MLRFATGTGEAENHGGTEGREAWPLLPDELFNEVMGMLELRWDYMVSKAEVETGVVADIGGLRNRWVGVSDKHLDKFKTRLFPGR